MTDFTPGMRVTWNDSKNRFGSCENGDMSGSIVKLRLSSDGTIQGAEIDLDADWHPGYFVPLSILRPASPAPVEIPGDTECAACNGVAAHYTTTNPTSVTNAFGPGVPLCGECWSTPPATKVVEKIRSRGGWPRKQAEVEMYGTQPGVLPETLPAGTLSTGGREALSEVRLIVHSYEGRWTNLSGGEQSTVGALFVDWSTVPRPPKPASSQLIDVFRQTVRCDDCGAELDALQACKRTRMFGGLKEYVPGTFCGKCPPKNASGSTGHQAPNKEGCGPSPADPVVPERPRLSPDGFLDRAYLDEQTAKRIPERDAARLSGAQSRHHQALAALDVKSGRPRYAETSRVFSTATWEEDS